MGYDKAYIDATEALKGKDVRPRRLSTEKVIYSPKKMSLDQKHRLVKQEMDYFLGQNPGYAFESVKLISEDFGTEVYELRFKRID